MENLKNIWFYFSTLVFSTVIGASITFFILTLVSLGDSYLIKNVIGESVLKQLGSSQLSWLLILLFWGFFIAIFIFLSFWVFNLTIKNKKKNPNLSTTRVWIFIHYSLFIIFIIYTLFVFGFENKYGLGDGGGLLVLPIFVLLPFLCVTFVLLMSYYFIYVKSKEKVNIS